MNLRDLLTAQRVATQVRATDWQHAVREAGWLLVDTGGVEPRYVEGMIRTAQELGPYIVIAPGIAIPHSRPEDGALAPCLAVITLDPPIPFGNIDNDPVRIVIAFAAVDHEQHVEALCNLASILSEPANIDALAAAETQQEILEVMWSDPPA